MVNLSDRAIPEVNCIVIPESIVSNDVTFRAVIGDYSLYRGFFYAPELLRRMFIPHEPIADCAIRLGLVYNAYNDSKLGVTDIRISGSWLSELQDVSNRKPAVRTL